MCCAIWYDLCNLKNVKNTHGGVLPFCTNGPNRAKLDKIIPQLDYTESQLDYAYSATKRLGPLFIYLFILS